MYEPWALPIIGVKVKPPMGHTSRRLSFVGSLDINVCLDQIYGCLLL